MAGVYFGVKTWKLTRDEAGYREYRAVHRVATTDSNDGPARVLATPGLPLPGSVWNFKNDLDIWVWCRANAEVRPVVEPGSNDEWEIEQIYSNRPPAPGSTQAQRCQDLAVEDPLLEPQKVSVSFVKYQEEATHDRFGMPIRSSSHEMLRGPQVEFDVTRWTVKIEQNVAAHNLPLVDSMRDTVNDTTLWGFPRRCVKLSNFTMEKVYYGQCSVYYKRTFEFDINGRTFDRDLLDEGTKVLNGHWDNTTGEWVLDNVGGDAPDPNNPQHFVRYKDRNGENLRVVLNGAGVPAGAVTGLDRQFIAIQGGVGGDTTNLNKAVTDGDFWVQFNGDIAPAEWNILVNYPKGSVATVSGAYYVALVQTLGHAPASNPTKWRSLPFGLFVEGLWSAATTYTRGDVVEDSQEEAAGVVHVEKYGESNFLLLGIPTVF